MTTIGCSKAPSVQQALFRCWEEFPQPRPSLFQKGILDCERPKRRLQSTSGGQPLQRLPNGIWTSIDSCNSGMNRPDGKLTNILDQRCSPTSAMESHATAHSRSTTKTTWTCCGSTERS